MSNVSNGSACSRRPFFHDWLWWLLLLPLLLLVLLVGLCVVCDKPDKSSYLFGVAAFSIAYALHFFSVSIALCGVYMKEVDDTKFKQLHKKESSIVTSAMCALAGGLGILLSGGLCAIGYTPILWGFIPSLYIASAILLLGSVLTYVLTQRKWPIEVRDILNGNRESAIR